MASSWGYWYATAKQRTTFKYFSFFLAERPKYTFDFSEEEDDADDDDANNNDLDELKVKASPVINDREDEFVPSDSLDKDEYDFSPIKSKSSPE